jgi:predicted amidohydrolase
MNPLSITFIQTELYWQDIPANLAMFEEKIWKIDDDTDVIVLPEMFNTGFSMDAKQLAEPVNFKTFKWMKQMASQKQACITGSYIVKDEGKYYNRLYWVDPEGNVYYYDKRHLFRMGDEHLTYAPGMERVIIRSGEWRIMPLICYDLRFPVWSRNTKDRDTEQPVYDLLIYVANWPAPRTDVWNTLLKARAVENQCYCLGVNRIGRDGMSVDYNGHSACYDFKGQPLITPADVDLIERVDLDLQALKEFRLKFPAYLDADQFKIQ